MRKKSSARKPVNAPHAAAIKAARGMSRRKPGGPSFAERMAKRKAEERALEEPLKSRLPMLVGQRIVPAMSTVQEIESAIEKLSLEEKAGLIAKLCGWSDDDWDRQMKADADSGRFAALNEDAGNAYHSGQTKPLDDVLDES